MYNVLHFADVVLRVVMNKCMYVLDVADLALGVVMNA